MEEWACPNCYIPPEQPCPLDKALSEFVCVNAYSYLCLHVWPVDFLVVKLSDSESQSKPVRPLIPALLFVCV